MSTRSEAPHPIPYQGSKRLLAPIILEYFPAKVRTLVEPFCGSAAVTLAALRNQRVRSVIINDSLAPLAELWRAIVANPQSVADGYERLWREQLVDPRAFYDQVRDEFNHDGEPAKLLFLLARCVKNAVRFNAQGQFNQSPDKRRLGTQPARMRDNLVRSSALLQGRTLVENADYAAVLKRATRADLVYMDPPYQGTSGDRDQRYHQQLDLGRFVESLERLVDRGVPMIISFDGRCGERSYGVELPAHLGLVRIEVNAGRSTQATLNGGSAETIESLYVSPALAKTPEARRSRSVRESSSTLPLPF
jgi:DNA adenine methylase